jgi:hypothetical protein
MPVSNFKIHLVCSGTSCNDIINILNKNKDTQHLRLKLQEIPLLDSIGVREVYLSQQNARVDNILNTSHVLSTIDYDAIESTLVLNNTRPSKSIILLPLIINSKKMQYYVQKIKELFGNGANTEKYWQHKNLNDQFTNIKEKVSQIDWQFIDPKKIHNGSFYYLKQVIKNIIIPIYNTYGGNFVIVCNHKLIIDTLKNSKGSVKYISKDHIVENSSVWSFDVTYDSFRMDSVFNNFEKVYPKEQNFTPLKIINNKTFEFEYRRDKFNLLNLQNPPTSIDFIKKLSLVRFPPEDKKKILEYFNKINNKRRNNLLSDVNNKENKTNAIFNNFAKL